MPSSATRRLTRGSLRLLSAAVLLMEILLLCCSLLSNEYKMVLKYSSILGRVSPFLLPAHLRSLVHSETAWAGTLAVEH